MDGARSRRVEDMIPSLFLEFTGMTTIIRLAIRHMKNR